MHTHTHILRRMHTCNQARTHAHICKGVDAQTPSWPKQVSPQLVRQAAGSIILLQAQPVALSTSICNKGKQGRTTFPITGRSKLSSRGPRQFRGSCKVWLTRQNKSAVTAPVKWVCNWSSESDGGNELTKRKKKRMKGGKNEHKEIKAVWLKKEIKHEWKRKKMRRLIRNEHTQGR